MVISNTKNMLFNSCECQNFVENIKYTYSVTRFCKVSQLWQSLQSWAIFLRFIYYLAKFWTYFGKYTFGQIFIAVNGQMLKKIQKSGHTVHLLKNSDKEARNVPLNEWQI